MGPIASLFPAITTNTSGFCRAQSFAIGTIACELIAVIAALWTSHPSPSRASSMRATLNAGSGKPIAADSPSTKIRRVPVGFVPRAAIPARAYVPLAGKKRHPNCSFVVSAGDGQDRNPEIRPISHPGDSQYSSSDAEKEYGHTDGKEGAHEPFTPPHDFKARAVERVELKPLTGLMCLQFDVPG